MPIPFSVLARPEHRALLLCACRLESGPDKTRFLALLEPLDWDYFRPRLLNNGLIALFCHHVQGAEALLPAVMQRAVEREFSQGLQRRLMMIAELQSLVAFLKAENVRVLAYKGPILAHLAYGSVALRPFSDLDLLIAPEDKASVVALLQTRDYLPEALAMPADLEAKRQLRDYEMTLLPTAGVGAIDLHWAIAPPYDAFPLDFEALWRRRVASDLLPAVETFCREDLLLTLCAHGLKHRWNRLEWIGCVLALLQTSEKSQNGEKPLDWAQIEVTARELGSRRALHLGLQLAFDLAALTSDAAHVLAEIPPVMRRAVARDTVATRLAEQVWTTIFQRESPQDDEFVTAAALLFALRARRGWQAKWAYFWAINRAFLVPDVEDTIRHGSNGPHAYFSRLGRLILRRMHRLIVLRRF